MKIERKMQFFFCLLPGYNFIFASRGKDIGGKTELKLIVQVREAFQKRRGDKTSNVSSKDRYRMPLFRVICSESLKTCMQLQEVYPGIDLLFRNNKADQKALGKLRQFDLHDENEGTVFSLIRFYKVISDCTLPFKKVLLMSDGYIEPETRQFKPEIDFKTSKILARKGGSIPQGSSNRLWNLFPVSASNILQNCV